MATPDFNLLATLDVLLTEQNVARAAKRLRLSPSAMSRALARLRATTGDPLLVRAGRGLVPTPRALALRERIGPLVQELESVLRPLQALDVGALERTFTLRCSDGFVENFGATLVDHLAATAPGVRLRFVQKLDKDSAALRDGTVDLETGVIGAAMGPEVRAQALFRDRWIGVCREGHPLGRGDMTPERFVQGRHIAVSRRGVAGGPIDEALATLGLQRNVVAMAGGFVAALALARGTDLLACVPERHTAKLRAGLQSFELPFPTPELAISLFWHPRFQADPAHLWFRQLVVASCGDVQPWGIQG
ncbi:LysR family transcriptional regulator [Hydrogenophaga sp. OTU3427]|uniref:LysR family transcriptional regulator n=1 Tax=Hydrogenophaga sp. OTU3427 TaxID=3043856 RepID=UPI00313CE258